MAKTGHLLASAAGFILVAAFWVTPGLASQNSRLLTMEERAETRALNLQSVRGFAVEPTESGTASYAEDTTGEFDDEANTVDDFGIAETDESEEGTNAFYPDNVGANDDYPAIAAYDELWPLDRLSNPSEQLFNTPVEDINGYPVGHFRRVETRDNGNQMAVITLNAQRTIALLGEDIRYDPDRFVLVAGMTINDIDIIPSGWVR